VRIEIWSDVVCPWCYLGLERLRRALQRYDDAGDVELVFRPYQLDPSAPHEATPVIDTYVRKFGGPDNAFRIIEDMTAMAAAEGLEFNLDRALRVNTFDAHRLGEFAAARGMGVAMHERLLKAYFTDALDVGDLDVLADLAGQVGLDRGDARGWLATDGGVVEVREGLAEAAELGITAVPTFVIDRRFLVPGAQDPDTFLQILRQAAERSRAV
jgi:predicted DsbA family dithiol-disulfide isomerase